MSSYRSSRRDQQTAADSAEHVQLMCLAHGCPNRWSVSDLIGEGIRGWCSAHRWSHPADREAVTMQQQDLAVERARLAANKVAEQHRPLSRAQQAEALQRLRRATRRMAEGAEQ